MKAKGKARRGRAGAGNGYEAGTVVSYPQYSITLSDSQEHLEALERRPMLAALEVGDD